MSAIRVVVVEDEGMIRDAFAQLLGLQDDIEIVGLASDGREGLAMVRALRPDVVVTDVEMPEMSGLDMAETIRDEELPCAVLVVSTFARSGYLRRAMDANVAGYVLKAAPVAELVAALRTVHEGGRVVAPELAMRAWEAPATLTDRERQVLRLAGEGLPNAEIAARLHLAEGTVRNYLSAAITKLHARNRTEAAEAARERGLL